MQMSKSLLFDVPSNRHSYLNVAAICPRTRVLGPGYRFVIWVQGCCFNCRQCISPEWRAIKLANLFTITELAEVILKTSQIEGITLSGGEPMLQAGKLHQLISRVQMKRELTVICYTGFTLLDLQDSENPDVVSLLAAIDVLIDGLYVDQLNDNRGLRGSTNQRIHFLSGIYENEAHRFLNSPRQLEMHLFEERFLTVGIHSRNWKS